MVPRADRVTEPTPTPATPLWQPQPAVQTPTPAYPPLDWPAADAQPPVQTPWQPTPTQAQWEPTPMQPMPPAPWEQTGFQPQPQDPRWRSALPVEPKRYSQFLQTPRRRWWKLPIALVVAGLTWLIGSTIATVPALVYDLFDQKVTLTDPAAIQSYLSTIQTHVTPAIFLANNVGIILMIPSAWLGLIIYGQKPRWLSSVVGKLRWGWMFRLMGLILIPYLLMQGLDALGGAYSGLSWKPYSIFMILVVLITTPLQCAGEEYGTRGLINRLLGSYGSARVSFWIGAIGSSLVFMSLHMARDPYLNAFYFTFGMVACWMVWRTGGLEASIAMHVVNNVLAMATLPFSDFSGIFNREAGSANFIAVIPLAVVMLACVGIVEWQVRTRKPVAVAAPGLDDAPPRPFRVPIPAAS